MTESSEPVSEPEAAPLVGRSGLPPEIGEHAAQLREV
jgi:hypothetical protein